MSAQTMSLAAETEALREAYAALNRNDISGFVKVFDSQIERMELLELPSGGTYHGLEAVTAHVSDGRSTWAEVGGEPERFVVAGDNVIVFVHVLARLKDHTEWIEGRTADVYTWRNGKAVQFRTFADERQALEWAGVDASGEDISRK